MGRDGQGLLVFAVVIALELVAFRWDVHPETTLPTYRTGALNLEADEIAGICRWREVDVLAFDIGGAIVGQRQLINSLCSLRCSHDVQLSGV